MHCQYRSSDSPEHSKQPSTMSLSILLIDDENQVLETSKLALRTSGFKDILTCNDSREVITIISNNSVGVIVMDIMMPHTTGKELLPNTLRYGTCKAKLFLRMSGQTRWLTILRRCIGKSNSQTSCQRSCNLLGLYCQWRRAQSQLKRYMQPCAV